MTVARLNLPHYERVEHVPGPYRLTPDEARALLAQVQQSMPFDEFRRLTVLELLSAYQDRKAAYLIKALTREPLRFAAKATSSDGETGSPVPPSPSEPSAGGGGLGEVASTASGNAG